MDAVIESFRDEYRFLSNFALLESPTIHEGLAYITNEHFYIAMKTNDVRLREEVAAHPLKGVKKFGRTLPIRKEWEHIKLTVMKHGLMHKFSDSNPILRQQLIDTGDVYIQEGNHWGDKFWGVCLKTNKGDNHLGRLLMQIRDEIS